MAKQFNVNTLLLGKQTITAIGNTLYINGNPVQGSASSGSAGVTGFSVTGSAIQTGVLNFETGSGISIILDGNTVHIGVNPSNLTTISGIGGTQVISSGQYLLVSGGAGGNYVDLTTNQSINGDKDFIGHLTVSGVPVSTGGSLGGNYVDLTTNQSINGDKNFIGHLTVSGVPVSTGGSLGGNYVDLTTNQSINGDKDFIGHLTVSGVPVSTGGPGGNYVDLTTDQTISGHKVFSSYAGIYNNNPQFHLDVSGTGNFSQGLRVSGRNVLMAPMEKGKTATWTNVDGIPSGTYFTAVWRCNIPSTVTGISAYRMGGSGAFVNAYKNNTSLPHLSTNMNISSGSGWFVSGTVINANYSEGDTLILGIISVTGLPSSISIQAELIA